MAELTAAELATIRARHLADQPPGMEAWQFWMDAYAQASSDRYQLLGHVAALEAKLAEGADILDGWRKWAEGFPFFSDDDDDLGDLILEPQPTQEPQP